MFKRVLQRTGVTVMTVFTPAAFGQTQSSMTLADQRDAMEAISLVVFDKYKPLLVIGSLPSAMPDPGDQRCGQYFLYQELGGRRWPIFYYRVGELISRDSFFARTLRVVVVPKYGTPTVEHRFPGGFVDRTSEAIITISQADFDKSSCLSKSSLSRPAKD